MTTIKIRVRTKDNDNVLTFFFNPENGKQQEFTNHEIGITAEVEELS
jgi:hypothetical protein